jgi:predicted metal-dependent hydrolase
MHRPRRLDDRQALLREWYLQRARTIYANRLHAVFGPFEGLGHSPPRIIIRDLTHRWGSLTSLGNLVMSRQLVRAPRQCIDYVLVHELCHLEHKNHGAAFWSLLNRMMPDHEKRKAKLERMLL